MFGSFPRNGPGHRKSIIWHPHFADDGEEPVAGNVQGGFLGDALFHKFGLGDMQGFGPASKGGGKLIHLSDMGGGCGINHAERSLRTVKLQESSQRLLASLPSEKGGWSGLQSKYQHFVVADEVGRY